ncbi:recombination regulator RecX [Deinococcus deserti]|uniref:Regulatory protein RecX n=1 Tax=Deinococcus deserti (strain DSM 17065 / CIP 109153 / LMG 22923 / VCD115) TaxID=546414 RepID=C1CVD4_DEIDV|nr:recombination regulator RecX [Deinococcus deserti]ACO46151.1 putative Regulatory protein RecX [Deinococcus deserti VCD115]
MYRARRRARTPGEGEAPGTDTGHPVRPERRTPPTPDEAREALMAYALRALAARAMTASELRAKLERRSEDEALVTAVLERVRELGYQDDTQVARAENSRRGIGAFRVRQTLKRRGVEETLIEDTVAARDPQAEAQEIRNLLERRWSSFARKKDAAASAYAFLARRGYSGALIWPAIREQQAQAGLDVSDVPEEES